MSPSQPRPGSGSLAVIVALVASLALPLAACGDDEVSGEGGGGSVTSSEAATGSSGSTVAATGATTATSASVGSGGESGTGGEGDAGGAGGAGEGGAGGDGEGGAGGGGPLCPEQPLPYALEEDVEDACAVIEADGDAPLFHVQFFPEIKEIAYDGTAALDYAAQYVLYLPIEDIEDYDLVETRCQQLAGEDAPSCSESVLDISSVVSSCSMRYGARFGLDPENVNEGVNDFDFTLTLFKGCARVDSGFTVTVTYEPAG